MYKPPALTALTYQRGAAGTSATRTPSSARGKKGYLLSYLSLYLVDIEGFPLGHVEAPLNVNEKQLVEELLLRVLGESL